MPLLIVWGAIAIGALIASTSSCTLSYQTICTHGTASDVVDENQDASPNVKADVTANVSAIPAKPVITGPPGPK